MSVNTTPATPEVQAWKEHPITQRFVAWIDRQIADHERVLARIKADWPGISHVTSVRYEEEWREHEAQVCQLGYLRRAIALDVGLLVQVAIP